MSKNVLIACEESQTVCIEFRKRGFAAFSCDILKCSGGHPEWHILGDVLPILNGKCEFTTMDGQVHRIEGKWDLIIAHPPCTDLAVSGARWFAEKQKDGRQQKSIEFFLKFTEIDCQRVAIENPVCIMSRLYRKPDQIIQPYEFGHETRKTTCLWLKGLPKLVPTKIVEPIIDEYICKNGKIARFGRGIGVAADTSGKVYSFSDPMTAKIRSKTFPGIAEAMADQWGCLL